MQRVRLPFSKNREGGEKGRGDDLGFAFEVSALANAILPQEAHTYHDFRPACAGWGYACCQYSEETGRQMMLKLAMLQRRSCMTFARVELLKSFLESTKKTGVVLVVRALGTVPNNFF